MPSPISMNQCEFCRIIGGQSTAEVLFKNRRAIAILDINPIHYGHVLVMPLQHRETLIEVPDDELADLISAAKVVSKAIVDSLNPPGFNVFSNNGRAAGQSVFHFHFHITPRYDDDNIRFVLTLKKYVGDDMALYASRIRKHIRQAPVRAAL